MSHGLDCFYCDGETAHSFAAHVELFDNGFLRVTGESFQLFAATATVTVSARLGQLPYFLRLPEGGTVELPRNEESDSLVNAIRPPGPLARILHWLENRPYAVAGAALVLLAGIAVAFWLGPSRLAKRTAYLVPENLEAEAGLAGYATFARAAPQATRLDLQDVLRVRLAVERLEQARRFHLTPLLRSFQLGAPNAFALPGGIIIVSDELVQFTRSDDELAAVLAHEIAHVELRHGLQSVMRNNSVLVAASTLTGDLSRLSPAAGTLPFLLVQQGYAREFEREADAYAVDLLRAAKINPSALATVLERLERAHPSRAGNFTYLSTHPSNDARLQRLHEKITGGR